MIQKQRINLLLLVGIVINSAIFLKLIKYAFHTPQKYSTNYSTPIKYPILDTNNVPLALTTILYSAYIDPSEVSNPDFTLQRIQSVLPNMNIAKIKKQWNSNKRFIWLHRYLDNPSQIEEIALPEIYLIADQKRVYPHNNISAHILGFVDIDHIGISGLEYVYQKHLSEAPIQLTLDVRIQSILHKVLQEGMKEFEAQEANGIIANAETGEILAIVSLPDFNPNDRKTVTGAKLFDRNTIGVYEFGSVMKTATLALALSDPQQNLQTEIPIPEFVQYGKYKITDFNNNTPPTMSILQTFTKSSNKGNAILALNSGEEKQKALFELLGYFDSLKLSFPVAYPLYPKNWTKGTIITTAFGYGLAMTPLHALQGFARLVTGKNIKLSLIKNNSPEIFEEIFPSKLTQSIQYALRETVEHGYARKARAPGFFVGAKTGTANLRSGRNYIKGNNIVSCLAAFPLLSNNPLHKNASKYILMISLQSPKPSEKTRGYATAGWIAAPIMSKLIKEIGPILQIWGNPE